MKINTTKSLSALLETGKRICFSACLKETDVGVGVLLQAVDEPKEDEVAHADGVHSEVTSSLCRGLCFLHYSANKTSEGSQ